jgi:hypothetical protein
VDGSVTGSKTRRTANNWSPCPTSTPCSTSDAKSFFNLHTMSVPICCSCSVLRGLTSWTGQESVERAAQLAGNKEVKIDLAHDVIQGDFLRDAASGAATSADEDTATVSTANAACSTVYMEAEDELLSAAAVAAAAAAGPAAANGAAVSKGSKDVGWETAGAAAAPPPSPHKVSGDDVVLHVPDSKAAPGASAGDPNSSGASVTAAGGKLPHRCVESG